MTWGARRSGSPRPPPGSRAPESRCAASISRSSRSIPMRFAPPTIPIVRALNPRAHLCGYGLYATAGEPALRSLGVGTLIGGEFEGALVELARALAGRDGCGGAAPAP